VDFIEQLDGVISLLDSGEYTAAGINAKLRTLRDQLKPLFDQEIAAMQRAEVNRIVLKRIKDAKWISKGNFIDVLGKQLAYSLEWTEKGKSAAKQLHEYLVDLQYVTDSSTNPQNGEFPLFVDFVRNGAEQYLKDETSESPPSRGF
jgi:hypothetical protein